MLSLQLWNLVEGLNYRFSDMRENFSLIAYSQVKLQLATYIRCTCKSLFCKSGHIQYIVYVTRPAKIDHLSAKNRRFLACLLYHNLITIYTTATQSSSLLQNLMSFLLQLTEMGYCIQNGRYSQKYNLVQFALTWLIFVGPVTYISEEKYFMLYSMRPHQCRKHHCVTGLA